jgi:hypothetical protein
VDDPRYAKLRGPDDAAVLRRSTKRFVLVKIRSCRRPSRFLGFCGAPWTVATYMVAGAHAGPGAGAVVRLSSSGSVRPI